MFRYVFDVWICIYIYIQIILHILYQVFHFKIILLQKKKSDALQTSYSRGFEGKHYPTAIGSGLAWTRAEPRKKGIGRMGWPWNSLSHDGSMGLTVYLCIKNHPNVGKYTRYSTWILWVWIFGPNKNEWFFPPRFVQSETWRIWGETFAGTLRVISKNFKAQSRVITFNMFLRFGRATVSEMLEKRLLVRNHCANLTESWLRTDHLMDIWLCGFIFFKSSPLSLGFHDALWLWGAYFSNGWKPSPGTWFISVVARISCKCRRLAEPDAFSIRGFSEKPAPPVAELWHPINPKGTSG